MVWSWTFAPDRSRDHSVTDAGRSVVTSSKSVGDPSSRKTTTLKMTNRLLEPTSGEVRIDGEPTRSQLRRALARLVDAIPVALMREANYRVDRKEELEPLVAAARWLATGAVVASR
jgi:hypothetical protein